MFTAARGLDDGGRTYVFVGDDSGTAAYALGGGGIRGCARWQNATPGTSPVVAGGLLYVYDEIDGALLVRAPGSGAAAALAAGRRRATGTARSSSADGSSCRPAATTTAPRTSAIDIYHLPGR